MKDDGFLYLTTPNFFSHHRLQQIRNGVNPQDVFPPRGQNWDAHYHFREYTMRELLQFAREAGGSVEVAYYSSCWDSPELVRERLTRHPEHQSDLVLLIGRAPATARG